MSRFIVKHYIQDTEAWGKFYEGLMENMKGKTFEEAAADPSWGGNKCLLSPSSVNGDVAVCLWELPEGSKVENCEKFIEGFTGGEPMVKNVVYAIDGTMGLDNLNFYVYVKDVVNLATNGSFHGYAGDGELYFVHHNILDRPSWDAMFGVKVGLVKGKSTAAEVSEAWEVGDGVKALTWCGLGEKDAVCLWSLPKVSTEEDCQAVVDKLCEGYAKNDVFKVEPSTCIGGRLLHPDFYAQDVIAMAEASA